MHEGGVFNRNRSQDLRDRPGHDDRARPLPIVRTNAIQIDHVGAGGERGPRHLRTPRPYLSLRVLIEVGPRERVNQIEVSLNRLPP
jgi:hypothetical protein